MAPKLRDSLIFLGALFLVGFLPALNYLNEWRYPLFDAGAFIFLASFIVASAGAGVLAVRWTKARVVVLATAITVVFGYSGLAGGIAGSLGTMIPVLDAPLLGTVGLKGTIGFWIVLYCFLCPSLVLVDHHLDKTTQVFLVVLGAMTLVTLIQVKPQPALLDETGRPGQGRPDLAPFVLIIFDEHIGLAGLEGPEPHVITARQSVLKAYKEFRVVENAYSRHLRTYLSLSALFNYLDPGEPLPVTIKGEAGHDSEDAFVYRLTRNRMIEDLQSKGYKVTVLQTDHFDLCADQADLCATFRTQPLGRLLTLGFGPWERAYLLLHKIFSTNAFDLNHLLLAVLPMDQYARQTLRENPSGQALIMHQMVPHFPYMYDKDCVTLSPTNWTHPGDLTLSEAYPPYTRQIQCAAKMVSALVGQIKANGAWDQATFIVAGDHGSRLVQNWAFVAGTGTWPENESPTDPDLTEVFSTVFAVKSPGLPAGVDPIPVETQRAISYLMAARDTLCAEKRPVAFGLGEGKLYPEPHKFDEFALPERFRGDPQKDCWPPLQKSP